MNVGDCRACVCVRFVYVFCVCQFLVVCVCLLSEFVCSFVCV